MSKVTLLPYGSILAAFHGYQPANMTVIICSTLNVTLAMHKNINNVKMFELMHLTQLLPCLDCVQWSLNVCFGGLQ